MLMLIFTFKILITIILVLMLAFALVFPQNGKPTTIMDVIMWVTSSTLITVAVWVGLFNP